MAAGIAGYERTRYALRNQIPNDGADGFFTQDDAYGIPLG
jgi:hypothetical protein